LVDTAAKRWSVNCRPAHIARACLGRAARFINARREAMMSETLEVHVTNELVALIREALQTPGVLKEIYGDLARPGVAQVGKALGTVLGLGNTALWRVELMNAKAKVVIAKNLESYRAQLESVHADNIQPVPAELGVPIAEKLSYVADEELSRLYVNLLAKASTVDTANYAHPSFANIIGNLSPDEAVLLKAMYGKTSLPCVVAILVNKQPPSRHKVVGDLLTGLERSVKLSFPTNVQAYLSNFAGLGLIFINRAEHIVDAHANDELKTHYRPQVELIAFDREQWDIGFNEIKIDVTPYGKLFMDACLKNLAGK
jgi:Abortive infection alpha